MKKPAPVLAALLLVLFAAASGSAQTKVLQGIDALAAAAADQAVKILPSQKKVLAVSWFTFEGEPAGISDLLTAVLTTQLANKARGKAEVVNRQATDRILAETEFQMSELVDRASQVRIGRQLGADLILTGSIAAAGDLFKLNAQLVVVETGVVLGGFNLDFRLEKELAARMSHGSEVIRIEKRPVDRAGVATTTKVLEDFAGGRTEVQLSHAEWFGGPAVVSARGTAAVDPNAGPDGSACARFAFTAQIATDDVVGKWNESYLGFAAIVKPNAKPADYAGVSLGVRIEGCVLVQVVLRQQQKKGERSFVAELLLNEATWEDLKLPFAAFVPSERGTAFDPKTAFTLSVEVPYAENWHRFRRRTGRSLACTVLLDNVGLYQAKSADPAGLLDGFDDEIRRVAVVPELYGAARYSETDAGGNTVDRPTPGVRNVTMRVERRDGGPAGRCLAIVTRLEATRDLLPLLAKEMGTTLVLSLRLSRSLEGASLLSFFARSNLLSQGSLEYQDNEHERYYGGPEIHLNDTWGRIVVPFDELLAEEEPLADAKDWTATPVLQLFFDLPVAALREAATKGSIEFEVALDHLVTE
jgi:TolB-like protein